MTSNGKNLLIVLGLGAVVGGIAVAQVQPWNRPKANFSASQTRSTSEPSAVISVTPSTRNVASLSSANLAALRDLDSSFASLAEFVAPSVVKVSSDSDRTTDLYGRRVGGGGGVGTGVVFRSDGWILTNDHVVGGFDKVTVTMNDGREYVGSVRRAADSDIAMVKIDAKDLTAANFADSDSVRVGQFAMAVGSPFDLENTVTFGHVSALKRTKEISDARMSGSRFYPDLLQTDAAINQGNSGGPLFNIDGQVIGINSAIASTTGGSNGIGFAITSNFARMLAETLIEKGKVERAAIGLAPAEVKPYRLKELNLKGGAEVAQAPNDSPAAKAGLKVGDIITKIGETPVLDQMDLRSAMYRYAPGQTVDVAYVRDGQVKNAKVVLVKPSDITTRRTTTTVPPAQEDGMSPFGEMPDIKEFFRRGGEVPPSQGEAEDVPPLRSGTAKLGVGVSNLDAEARKKFSISGGPSEGAVVTEVEPGSVAEKLGLKPGMVIESLNGRPIRKVEDVRSAMAGVKWGDKIRMKFGQYKAGASMSQETDVFFR